MPKYIVQCFGQSVTIIIYISIIPLFVSPACKQECESSYYVRLYKDPEMTREDTQGAVRGITLGIVFTRILASRNTLSKDQS